MRHYDYDGALNYASLQLTLSNKLNYAWGKGKACNNIGLIQRFNGNMGISTNNFSGPQKFSFQQRLQQCCNSLQ